MMFDAHFNYIIPKSGRGTTLLLGFTVVLGHPKTEELLTYCHMQSGMVLVSIPIRFWSSPYKAQGLGGPRLDLLSSAFSADWWRLNVMGKFLNHSNLLHFKQIPGEVNLNLVKVRSKLSGPLYSKVLPTQQAWTFCSLDILALGRFEAWVF
jgi:hypothetical protein